MSRVVIIGAGIVGLSTARAAVKRGHEVVLLEKGPMPNPQGASFDLHRMIRAHYGAMEGYARMIAPAFDAWDRVWNDLGKEHFENTGAVAISLSPDDYADKTLQTFRKIGLDHEVHDRAGMEALAPHLDLPEGAWGVTGGRGGPLFASAIVTELTDWVRRHGVDMRDNTEVKAIDRAAGIAVLADGTTVQGDLLVIAAGAWVSNLLPELDGNPVYRQALCYVEPPADYKESWRNAPAIVAIGDHGGYTLPDRRGAGLKFGHGGHRRLQRPDITGFGSDLKAESDIVLGAFRPFLKQPDHYTPQRMQVGYYVLDPSRRFKVETNGKSVLVTNCDGQMFKFGPLMGEQIMRAFHGEQSAAELTNWAAAY
ncbi:FAD-dependent oxidoreductase [Pigmentiphaga aceris]|uniref:FAD-dependent oxidoreductase n=1 Tax=Pigmentiphaga aceris TaxID=1940612 RepID=A0A5C0AX06_9BURK|nr:FAD-dependent oxidoreductase [Pigmentiphaga aceris]QEI06306.1 FAD-dependent oxidoreductase [Pigmentiphaga aceris]